MAEAVEMEDVNKEVAADLAAEDTATTEPSSEETNEEEAAEEEVETEGKDESAEDEKAEEEVAEETEAPKGKVTAEERKAALSSEIRELVATREGLRSAIAAENAKVYAPQTADELIAGGIDPTTARMEALEQRTQMAEFNAHVADLNANLNAEALQVMHDFPVFDPQSPQYDKTLAERATGVYTQAANQQVDPRTGLIVQSNALPYNIYKAFAEIHAMGSQNGKVSGQQAAEKMLAATEPTSSLAPKTPKEDPFLKGLMPNA